MDDEGADMAFRYFQQLNLSYNYSDFMLSWLLNNTHQFIDHDIILKYSRNRSLDSSWTFFGLVAAYSLLIVLGSCGNGLVVVAVVRKPAMRTARNLFIVNLAVSDLLLCLVTMPLTLMEVLTTYWPLGTHDLPCKMLGAMQATSIFVSTISITAIALDRYHVIVYPTRPALQVVGAVGFLFVIWLTAVLLAAPLFIWRTLQVHAVNLEGISTVAFCVEEWPVQHGRALYSIFSLVVQYLLPIVTVSVAYSRICRKLHHRYVRSARKEPRRKEDKRMRRTNALLVAISLIFCVSWLPLNVYNVLVDVHNPFTDRQYMLIAYAICHMIGMSSACSNPLLYGWLNDNFRKEFKEILAVFCPWIPVEAVQERVNSIRSSMRESRRRRRAEKEVISQGRSGVASGDARGGAGSGNNGVRESDSLTAVGPSMEPVLTNVVAVNRDSQQGNNLSVDTQVAYRKALDTSVMVAENISGLTEMTVLTNTSPALQHQV
ncbi:neuropeptide F receptor [Neocloeon triangulifer]|uniref:neuropeptide F receptor n=1 Tax=Neocloeon triangulifer TaxID=2078957 RepID=UPI00286F608C|nr:neuropeptide F receptor [Neocloeon triangulifer]